MELFAIRQMLQMRYIYGHMAQMAIVLLMYLEVLSHLLEQVADCRPIMSFRLQYMEGKFDVLVHIIGI